MSLLKGEKGVGFLEGQWNLLGEIQSGAENEIEASCFVPADSPWFEGHFPGEPILPGIAIVHTVQQAILKDIQKKKERVFLDELRRIRFVQPVRPAEELKITVSREDTGGEILFSFKVTNKENIACSGLIIGKKIKQR
jgi:3-hydroxymyristoyl/3-hydroxydecanoyl-(acyl carrier protein) dehydratase